jgi:hypothetical protein
MHVPETVTPETVAPRTSAARPVDDGAAKQDLVNSTELGRAPQEVSPTDPGPIPHLAYPVVDGFITLSREELYKWVWTEPVRTLATQFGLSDVGLAKIIVALEPHQRERVGLRVPQTAGLELLPR